jgi:LPXTG-motif cell wall-anchored protein
MNPTVPVFPTVTNTNSTATATPSASATTEPTSSNELSTGAKAGIAVGAVTGVALLGLGFFLFQRRKQKQKLAAELDGFQTAHELAGTSNVWELPHKPDVTAELSSPHGIQEMHNDERELTDHIPSSPQELHGDDPVLPGPPRSPVGMDYINPADIENMHSSWSARLDK